VAVGVTVLAVAAATALVGAAGVARHRAGAAADLGVLAAAGQAIRGEPVACGRAATVVRANGARLGSCRLDGLDAVVTAETRAAALPRGLGTASATARAGPVRWLLAPREAVPAPPG
jgi:secretion/DNA translocation related TadE-like protein